MLCCHTANIIDFPTAHFHIQSLFQEVCPYVWLFGDVADNTTVQPQGTPAGHCLLQSNHIQMQSSHRLVSQQIPLLPGLGHGWGLAGDSVH